MKKYINATLLGGFAALLPLGLLILVARWLINLVQKYLGPIVEWFAKLIHMDSYWLLLASYVVLIIAILAAFLFIGMMIRTRTGRFFKKEFEQKYLMKIPGYKIARDTVKQFFGKNRSFFSEVVLVDLFNSGTLATGFITDDFGEYLTVFVPTGPNPTSGLIYHVKKDKVIRTGASVETAMKSVISCGAGSSQIFQEDLKS
ncbi:MAG: DUF502 domain-containing protein [Bacteroidales bacterium]|nr:DUF502 domain-containing protein [Bacteroidales bacterium]